MNSETIQAVAVLVTAIAPIVGAFLSYRLKIKAIGSQQNQDGEGLKVQLDKAAPFQRLMFNCFLVFFISGATSAGIGTIDNLDGNGEHWFYRDLCFFVGNTTIVLMMIFYAFTEKR